MKILITMCFGSYDHYQVLEFLYIGNYCAYVLNQHTGNTIVSNLQQL
jgi:hypothetical protein